MARTVLNLSHPLSAEARKMVYGDLNADKIVRIPVQVDLSSQESFDESIAGILAATSMALNADDYIVGVIPPGLSVATVAILPKLSRLSSGAAVIVMAKDSASVAPRYVPIAYIRDFFSNLERC